MALLVGAVLQEAGCEATVFFPTATAHVCVHHVHEGLGVDGEGGHRPKKVRAEKAAECVPQVTGCRGDAR